MAAVARLLARACIQAPPNLVPMTNAGRWLAPGRRPGRCLTADARPCQPRTALARFDELAAVTEAGYDMVGG